MQNNFLVKLDQQQRDKKSNLVVLLKPRRERLPLSITRFDEPLLPYGKALIQSTHSLVCAYMFDFASYLALGAAGAVALERTIAYARSFALTVLHGAFASIDYSAMSDYVAFGVDAITVSESNLLKHYMNNPPYFAFIQSDTVPEPLASNYYHEDRLLIHLPSVRDSLRVISDEQLIDIRADNFASKGRSVLQKLIE